MQVTSAAPLLDTTNATLGAIIQGKQITQLPLNGLNFTNLALLSPGVTRGNYGNTESGVGGSAETFRYNESGGASLSVNGLQPQANNFILDGVDNNDDWTNTILVFPPIFGTQEFKIDTSVAPAQYGRAGGAIVISSIKSGTNSIHGSVFEYYRSGKFDSNPYYQFLGAGPTPNPEYNRNQFGGNVGLPIIKNKLFIFGDYQAWRESVPVGSSFVTVPTPLMRQGNLSEVLDPALTGGNYMNHSNLCMPNNAPNTGEIFDPITCQPFPGNIIPSDRLNPAAVNYLNAFPLPTPSLAARSILDNFETFQTSAIKYNDFDVRLDWTASAKDLLFARFSYDNAVQEKSSMFPNLPAGYGSGTSYTHARSYDLGYTHTFTQNVVNEFHLAYNRDNYGYMPPMYGIPVSKDLGIVNANRNLETSGGALIGGYNGEIEYTGDYGLYAVPQNNIEGTNTFDWEHGNHSFKFGGTLIHRQLEYYNSVAGKGYFFISGNGQDFTGYEVSDLLASFMDTYSIGAQTGYASQIFQEDGIFAQDDWRVNQRLTVNIGLRWDLLTWPYESHNRQASFDINTGQVLLAGQNGVSSSILNQNYHNFGPRLGFAYDLLGNGKSVVRGGYGIYYYPTYGGTLTAPLSDQPPFGGASSYYARLGSCITFTGQTPAPGTNGFDSCKVSSANQTTPLPLPGFPNFNPAQPPQGLSIVAVDRNNQNSQIQEWNMQLDQQMGAKNVVDIAYVGTKADHIVNRYPYNLYQFSDGPSGEGNQNFPNLGSITYEIYNGSSNYTGLQLQAEHRATNLITTAAYTWSHTMDDTCGTLCLYYAPQASYGNSGQDERNVFSFSTVYFLPFGRGQRFGGNDSRPMDWLIGGWQTNIIALISSGQPFDLSTGQTDSSNEPDEVSPIRYTKSISGYWFNPASFSSNIPTSTTSNNITVYTRPGTARRNQVYGPGQRVVNYSMQKDVHMTDRFNLELHGDAFNVFNTPQFTNPGSGMNDAQTFGKVTGVQAYSNRQIQLAARIVF
ncbi:MAG: TonB-dependent receptor [Acidobacteriaceae bacterium]